MLARVRAGSACPALWLGLAVQVRHRADVPNQPGPLQSPSGPSSQKRVKQQQQAANGYNERGCDVHRRRHYHATRNHRHSAAHLLRNHVEGFTGYPVALSSRADQGAAAQDLKRPCRRSAQVEFIAERVGYVEVNCDGFTIAEASASVSSALGSAGQRVFHSPRGI